MNYVYLKPDVFSLIVASSLGKEENTNVKTNKEFS